jgi:hypothetical protein
MGFSMKVREEFKDASVLKGILSRTLALSYKSIIYMYICINVYMHQFNINVYMHQFKVKN